MTEILFQDTFLTIKTNLKNIQKNYLQNKNEITLNSSSFPLSSLSFPSSLSSLSSSSSSLDNKINYKLKLELIKNLKNNINKTILNSYIKIKDIEILLKNIKEYSINLCLKYSKYSLKQLQLQNNIAERRLRELVYEIIGEYGKCIIRAKRRQLYLRLSNRVHQVWSINILRWKLFITRLLFEIFSFLEDKNLLKLSLKQYTILDPHIHSEEYHIICNILSNLIQKDWKKDVDNPIINISGIFFYEHKYDDVNQNLLKKNNTVSRPTTTMNNRLSRGTSKGDEDISTNNNHSNNNNNININNNINNSNSNNNDISSPFILAQTISEIKDLITMFKSLLNPLKNISTNSTQTSRPRSATGTKISNTTLNRPSSGNLSRISNNTRSQSLQGISQPSISIVGKDSCNFISNQYIEWLKPCSYHTLSQNLLSYYLKDTPPINRFDQFTRQYVTQYTINTYSEYLYFCLEERYWSGISADDLLLPNTNINTSNNNHNDNNNNNNNNNIGSNFQKSNELKILQAIKYLQVYYCFQTNDNNQNNQKSLSNIRQLLFEGGVGALLVVEQLSNHRNNNNNDNDNNKKKGLLTSTNLSPVTNYPNEILSNFPNILRVRNVVNNQVFHFAPAVLLNLVETVNFNNSSYGYGAISSDQMRVIGGRCPHPLLPLLCSSTSPAPLQNLYIIGNFTSQIKTDNISNFNQLLLPLSSTCEKELLRLYLWPNKSTLDQIGSRSSSRASSRSSTQYPHEYLGINDESIISIPEHLSYIPSCLDLLPDDPTDRSFSHLKGNNQLCFELEANISLKSPSNSNNSQDYHRPNTSERKSSPRMNLQYRYALIKSEYIEKFQKDENDHNNNNNNNNNNSSNRQEPINKTGYYFIQYRLIDPNINQTIHPDLFLDSQLSSSVQTNSSSSSSQLTDYYLFEQILKGYHEGIIKKSKNKFTKSNNNNSSNNNNNNDLTILSTVCRWRSCLSESCPESNNKYLCHYHNNLKKFLDDDYNSSSNNSNGNNGNNNSNFKESLKYLPKKINMTNLISNSHSNSNDNDNNNGNKYSKYKEISNDLLYITSYCTLITELWDGKLYHTLNTFINKICNNELNNLKKLINNNKNNYINYNDNLLNFISVPNWNKWRNSNEFNEVNINYDNNIHLINMIIELEKNITNEIILLNKLKVFPLTEIIFIKKEMKLLREKLQNNMNENDFNYLVYYNDRMVLENELLISEKKYITLKNKRIEEEENKLINKKRIAKMRQMEEIQAKDPLNFRNQKSF